MMLCEMLNFKARARSQKRATERVSEKEDFSKNDAHTANGGESGNQRHDSAMAAKKLPNMQHSELIDLISDDESAESQANEFSKDKQTVAAQVQPAMQLRTCEKDDGNNQHTFGEEVQIGRCGGHGEAAQM